MEKIKIEPNDAFLYPAADDDHRRGGGRQGQLPRGDWVSRVNSSRR
ncbi:MAG: hypothetical protein MZV70_50100 [Desulfobacterales bacterium]|nr:hypothetical protein [Desulfobacterales bacterium]